MLVTNEIRSLILDGKNDLEILKQAQKEGMTTMYQDALIKGIKGIIPIEEVNKISVNASDDFAEDMFTKDLNQEVQEL